MKDLEGTTALVTGAGRGLGREISLALARAGARVSLFSLVESELEETVQELGGINGEHLVMAGDVSQRRDAAAAVGATMKRFGRLDVLVNNAGIIGPARFVEDATPEAWERTLGVNLHGAYHFCREAIPSMMAARGGSIINIVSGLGAMPFPRFCAYSVSKAGLIQLTRSLAEELKALDIRVNAIDPGLMDTHLGNDIRSMGASVLGEDLHGRMVGYKEQGVLKDPGVIAGLVAYLASQRSRDMTGHVGTLRYFRGLGWGG